MELAERARTAPSQTDHGARLLSEDVLTWLLLADEARYRVVARLFGVSRRDQSRLVTVIALLVLADAIHDTAARVLSTPAPTLGDMMLAGAVPRELAYRIVGPAAPEIPQLVTLLGIAAVGTALSPALRRSLQGIRASSHRARLAFGGRYGPRRR